MIHTADVEGLRTKIHQLHTEHRDLDDVISRLSQSAAQDQLQLQRLKKRKLRTYPPERGVRDPQQPT
jgi:hypothetical protein